MDRRLLLALLAVACVARAVPPPPGSPRRPEQADRLARPALNSALASQRLITVLARAGGRRIVAAGLRGHILFSDDAGASWTQAQVPVASDLTALQFVSATVGYAAGHDGVVLGSRDGGASWTRLLDGRQANTLLVEHLKRRIAEGASGLDALLAEAERNAEAGPDKPFLDLWFSDADHGFVVGAYNLIFRTEDGGKTWQPWYERSENPKLLNLYAIRPFGRSLYIAGEGGLLMKLDDGGEHFASLPSPYKGSFFGLLASADRLIAFGMRGHAFASRDEGRSWQPIATGLNASITAGTALPDGSLVLVDLSGGIASSADGERFVRVELPSPTPLAAVAAAPGALILGGPRGLRTLPLPQTPKGR